MTARHRVRQLDAPRSPRKTTPHYEPPPLKLTEAERVALAHGIWEARRVLLIVAAQHVALRPMALPAAKHCTQAVEAIWPEPMRDE